MDSSTAGNVMPSFIYLHWADWHGQRIKETSKNDANISREETENKTRVGNHHYDHRNHIKDNPKSNEGANNEATLAFAKMPRSLKRIHRTSTLDYNSRHNRKHDNIKKKERKPGNVLQCQ